jgi:hypothetical protein
MRPKLTSETIGCNRFGDLMYAPRRGPYCTPSGTGHSFSNSARSSICSTQTVRDRLATADLRLSVLLAAAAAAGYGSVSATIVTGGVVHGPTRAQLDPAHAQRIIGVTDDGDRGLIALGACQAYINNVMMLK